ncbi:MAG: GH13_38 / GH13 / GH13_36 / GH13_20 / GH13 _2 / GH13_1 / GH13_30 [uncultured Segetibacter sp.]|uniref:GH13_38 / GH13 / GH13_36 / GH13_20 / GH13 _2 / GH13_1 / GH13_30 n=1 Tax=uncultured Segetibacter sp. TaxID=481133 RepID=A0A6J4TSM8_9BACT|nr:MAG: GH13_38 / GH13 / GH13_36 / GH13_20 / GH13 _2 / GH13_1 / GH13_30 [uncultured Segetibacter sp.]
MKKNGLLILLILLVLGCNSIRKPVPSNAKLALKPGKIVIYQVFTRLFGNTNTTNKLWGTIEENGVGKFNDFTDKALEEIKALGVTHIWYTGVPHHAVISDYTSIGITNDDPDVVKGRAGSPYAVKDYYNVDPDLATDPAKRLDEFRELVQRTHKHGLKVIIDIVPNHVARQYVSKQKPDSVQDFGANDLMTTEYSRDNSFYYMPRQSFKVPIPQNGYKPLGGQSHPLSDGRFEEQPAKWTGNGSRLAQPKFDDWYETVKINYGVRPDGTKDFDTLPVEYAARSVTAHYAFWQNKTVPASWKKFRDIALFWLSLGVDGFRFDMAEMVPVEFWSYMNVSIKTYKPSAEVVAEVYNPTQYRNYIYLGKMDYLYDKVELYDSLKYIMQGNGSTDNLPAIQQRLADIEHHMLHFLENHDEQRIASAGFAGNPEKAKPAMVVSATISTSPTLIYFGQETGEPGAEDAGFGKPTRTSIFDYVGVPHHQRWMNGGKFDGGQLSATERSLRDFYKRLLNFTVSSSALTGEFSDLHAWNRKHAGSYNDKLYSYVRWSNEQKIVVLCNFGSKTGFDGRLQIPREIINKWSLKDGSYALKDELYGKANFELVVSNGTGFANLALQPLESLVLSLP